MMARLRDLRNLVIIASVSLAFLGTLCHPCQGTTSHRPPSLAQTLRSSYTINPSVLPLFRECQFRGEPDPVVTWTLDGQSIPETEQSRGPYIDDSGFLILRQAGPSDSGQYTCMGSNYLGNASASTYITIEESDSPPVWQLWWMWFVYAGVVWVLSSLCLLAIFCCRYHTTKKNPIPVDRNECFAIDNDTSGNGRRGFPNPAYPNRSRGSNGQTEPFEVEMVDGNHTRVSSFTRDYQGIAGGASGGSQGEIRSSGRRKSTNSAYVDAKLQLVELPNETFSTQQQQIPPCDGRPPSSSERPIEVWVEQ